MRTLAINVCLIFVALVGSVGTSWGADKTSFQFESVKFHSGVNAQESEAIAAALGESLTSSFNLYLTSTHFVYGPKCENSNQDSCRQNLKFELSFKAASLDLNGDDKDELIVELIGPNECGSGGCTAYILKERTKGWAVIGKIFGAGSALEVSKNAKVNGFRVFSYPGKYSKKVITCKFREARYTCE